MLTKRLTGQALLDYVNANPSMTHTERCTGAGYLKELKDGSHGCSFTEFFEALLAAKNGSSQKGSDWLEGLTDQDRSLYEMIEDRCPEFTKLDASQCRAFMDELSEYGITTAEQFEDAYHYQTDSWSAESDFAQFYAEEIACLNQFADAGMLSMIVIDWQATWDCNLRHDFFNFEFDGVTYFFHSNF